MNYRLLKDLPNCPAGRILKLTDSGMYYCTDIGPKESIQFYSWPIVDVINNPHWFEEITEDENNE